MNTRGGKSPDNHVLISPPTSEDFAIAYLDFPRGPETELWLYSSLERRQATKTCEEQIDGIFTRTEEIEKTFSGQRQTPGVVLIGSLHEKVFDVMQKRTCQEFHGALL